MAAAAIRVLLVDDYAPWRKQCARILRGEWQVVETGSCEEAMALLKADSAFDLVLLDLDFGPRRIRGDDALPLLQRGWPTLPVVVLTVDAGAVSAVSLLKLGAIDYLVKDGSAGAWLKPRLNDIVENLELAREVRVLRILLEARLEAQRAHDSAARDTVPLLPPSATWRRDDVDRDYCALVLRSCGGNIREAARRLSCPYSSLRADLVRWRLIAAREELPEAERSSAESQ
jgi:DNA-binding NtrC family response regulator